MSSITDPGGQNDFKGVLGSLVTSSFAFLPYYTAAGGPHQMLMPWSQHCSLLLQEINFLCLNKLFNLWCSATDKQNRLSQQIWKLVKSIKQKLEVNFILSSCCIFWYTEFFNQVCGKNNERRGTMTL